MSLQEKHQDEKSQTEATDTTEEVLEWVTHPLKKKPWVAVGVTFFVLVVSFLVLLITSSKVFTLLTLIVMFASLSKFYFPTKFRLTDKKITVRYIIQTLTKDWTMYRSYYPDKNGVLLSPFLQPSRLENFRGLYLMFAGNKEEVVNFIKTHINKDFEPLSKEETKDQ